MRVVLDGRYVVSMYSWDQDRSIARTYAWEKACAWYFQLQQCIGDLCSVLSICTCSVNEEIATYIAGAVLV